MIKWQRFGDVVVFFVDGVLDKDKAAEMAGEVKEMEKIGVKKMAMDVTEVEKFTATGISYILNELYYLTKKETTLRFVGVGDRLQEFVDMKSLERISNFHETLQQALKAFEKDVHLL